MRQRAFVRSIVLVAVLAAVAAATSACGGGGSQGPDDLYLQKFLLVDQNLDNIGGTGATNAFRDTRLLFVFNTAVDPATVSDRTIRIGIPSSEDLFLEAPGRFEVVDGHPNWVLFDPTISRNNQTDVHDNPFGLDSNAQYNIEIAAIGDAPKVLYSDAGKPIVLSFSASFKTGDDYIQDFKQPVLESTEPANNEFDVSPTADVLLHFSEPMRPDTFRLGETLIVRDLTNDIDVLGQVRFSADAKTVTFRPVFGYGKGPNQIFVRVTTDASNLPGNPIPKEIRFQFTTRNDESQPDFEDITESFDDNAYEDTGYAATYPLANWNAGVTSGFLAGALTTGTITRQGTISTYLWPPWSWGNNFAGQFQYVVYSSEIGSSRTITGLDWRYNTNQTAVVHAVTVNLGHTKQGALTTNFAGNFSDTPVTVAANVNSYTIPGTPSEAWLAFPTFTQNWRYNGSDNMIIEIYATCGSVGYNTVWAGLWRLISTTAPAARAAYTLPTAAGGGSTANTYELWIRINYLIDQSEAQSLWYDTGLTAGNAQFLDAVIFPSINSQPAGSQTTLEFQGGPTSPDDPTAPDLTKLSQWTSDLTDLSGYRFVRFHVVFRANQTTGQVPAYDEFVLPFIFY